MWNGLRALLPSLPKIWQPQLQLPQPCLLCAAPGTHLLCPDCEFDLPYLTRHPYRCEICALPLPGDSHYCGHCLKTPPAFDCCRAACTYDYPLDHLIHAFKYRRKLAAGRALSGLLADLLSAERSETETTDSPELLIPVPMHWSRRLKRGFNQTELLAADLGRALDLPMLSRVCRRHQRTQTQQGLTRRARINNLDRAFSLRPDARARIAGRRIALIDDVVTTTSTVRALSRLLTEGGASSVEVWALARTPEAH